MEICSGRKMWKFKSSSVILCVLVVMEYLVMKANAHRCFMLNCLGCPTQAMFRRGESVECHPSNWVTAVWLHNLGHPPPSTASIMPIEYRCLKMIATPDDYTLGHTVDAIRGCVPAVQVESVCTGLVAVERARGHSDARCSVCSGVNCNGAANTPTDKALSVGVFAVVAATYWLFRLLFCM